MNVLDPSTALGTDRAEEVQDEIAAVLIPVVIAIMIVLLTTTVIWLLWRNARKSAAAPSG